MKGVAPEAGGARVESGRSECHASFLCATAANAFILLHVRTARTRLRKHLLRRPRTPTPLCMICQGFKLAAFVNHLPQCAEGVH